jgi:hypothetical protein
MHVFRHDRILRIVLPCIMCNSYGAVIRRVVKIVKIAIAIVKCQFSHHIYIRNECRLI